MTLAFEVFEHFADPATELGNLFSSSPRVVLATTQLYSCKRKIGGISSPKADSMSFFYGEQAPAVIAARHGYDVIKRNAFLLFAKKGLLTPTKRRAAYFLLNPKNFKWMQALMAFRATPGVWKDHDAQRARAQDAQK